MSLNRRLRIFVNYRREETSGHAGRLYDALVTRFGDADVFMDIDRIEPGLDFADVIGEAVASCDVLIAVVGSRWLTASDGKGRKRIENPEDFVRMELEAALSRDVRVIPALVQDTEMPTSDELPETIRPFARRHAVQLSDTRWTFDVGRLIQTLERLEAQLAEQEARQRAEGEAQAEQEAHQRAEAKRAAEQRAEAKREAQQHAEAEDRELASGLDDEASSPRDAEPAQRPEAALADASAVPVDQPGAVRPTAVARRFAYLDPRGELSGPARLMRVVLLTVAVVIVAYLGLIILLTFYYLLGGG